MRRAVTAFLPAVLFLLLWGAPRAEAQINFIPGAVIYVGDNSADLVMFNLTDTDFSKVEFYRGAKLLGTVRLNQDDGKIITDYDLQKGNQYQYQFRAYRSAGGFLDGNLPGGVFLGGDIQGILTRPDTINIQTDLVDTVEVWPGGDMHFAKGADISWILGTAGTVSGIKVFGSNDPSQTWHGQFSASGGRIYDINIECSGQMGPLKDFTFVGSDVNIREDIESRLDNVTFDWVTDQQRNDYAYMKHFHNNLYAKNCHLTHEAQLWGAKEADNMLIDENATLVASKVTNSTVNMGQITISPKDVPTSMEYCTIEDGNVTISNETVVRYNTLESRASINISPLAGGFDPKDVGDVHINYNHFVRDNADRIGNISNFSFDTDTIDGTMNYWGICTGPKPGERATMGKVKLDPFLRVEYPEASYWMSLEPSKRNVIANSEDSIVFTGHVYNVLTGVDSAGVEVRYRLEILGDTLVQGTLVSDAQGRFSLAITIPPEYSNVTGFSMFFETDLQCIAKAFLLSVEKQTGPDLQVYEPEIIQGNAETNTIVPNKAIAVRTTITTTEGISTPFKVIVEANNNTYDTFYMYDEDHIGVDYTFEDPMTELTLERGQPVLLIFFVDELGFDAGTVEVTVTVDPPEAGDSKGRVVEANEFNNSVVVYHEAKNTAFGNEGDPEVNIFVQGADGYPQGSLGRLQGWADSAKTFMEKAWPMNPGQAQFTTAQQMADYSYMGFADTLLQETWQPYLVKAYKQMRIADPAQDRYLMAVQPGWFGNRLDREEFNHRASQTLNWSGIWDFAVSSADHWKHGVHLLGHSFGLRRGDLDPDNPEQQEQYRNFFIGLPIEDALDISEERIIRDRARNKVSRLMNTRCFMGSSQLPSGQTGGFDYFIWISKVEYENLFAEVQNFTGRKKSFSKTGTVEKALFIEGSVDSTDMMFSFGPWLRLADATPSSMMDPAYATHTFKVLDASNQELASYLYHPTFRAQGLDEVDALTAPDPKMETEHFAFVVPCPDDARRVVVEHDGNIVAERILSQNKPVVKIDFPANNQDVKTDSLLARWSATDPDGDTEFWYTVWFSSDNGMTWETMQFETQAQQDSIFGEANKSGYRLRVVANDGVNISDTVEVAFSILTSNERIPTPSAFNLEQNYPNPFNPSTTLSFTLPVSGEVSLIVYDALGRPVATAVDGYRSAGTHHVGFDASGLSSGTYLAVLRFGGKTASIRMTLAR